MGKQATRPARLTSVPSITSTPSSQRRPASLPSGSFPSSSNPCPDRSNGSLQGSIQQDMPTSFPFLAIEYFSPLDLAFSWGGGSLGRDIVAGMRLDGNSSFINISSFVALAIIPRESHTEGEIGYQVMLTSHVFTFARSITTENRSI